MLLLDWITRLLGEGWNLSAGILPQSLYADAYRFFTDESEIRKRWKYVRIWYAIESEGMSDGTQLTEEEKAWDIDSIGIGLEGKGEVLSESLMRSWESFINDQLYNASPEDANQLGIVNRHNANENYKKWASSAIFLGVEGDFRRLAAHKARLKRIGGRRDTGKSSVKAKAGRSKSGQQVSKT